MLVQRFKRAAMQLFQSHQLSINALRSTHLLSFGFCHVAYPCTFLVPSNSQITSSLSWWGVPPNLLRRIILSTLCRIYMSSSDWVMLAFKLNGFRLRCLRRCLSLEVAALLENKNNFKHRKDKGNPWFARKSMEHAGFSIATFDYRRLFLIL